MGHYKPVQENETRDTERFHQRTLAVLPLDNPEICEIKVHVLKDVSKDIYEQVFLVRNVSKTSSAEIVEGSLYIDFVIRPQMKIISHLGKLKIGSYYTCVLPTFFFFNRILNANFLLVNCKLNEIMLKHESYKQYKICHASN